MGSGDTKKSKNSEFMPNIKEAGMTILGRRGSKTGTRIWCFLFIAMCNSLSSTHKEVTLFFLVEMRDKRRCWGLSLQGPIRKHLCSNILIDCPRVPRKNSRTSSFFTANYFAAITFFFKSTLVVVSLFHFVPASCFSCLFLTLPSFTYKMKCIHFKILFLIQGSS